MKNILNNKVLRCIGKIIYILLYVIIILALLVVLIQRFSNNNTAIAGFRIFNVATGSMVPEYNVGDIIVSKECSPETIEVGDDIAYEGNKNELDGKIITHRVISKREENGKYYFVTKGIASEVEDPEISEDQIYGKITYKSVILSFISKIINNIYAFYFLIFIPIATIICKMIVSNIISYKKTKEENIEIEKQEEQNTKQNTKIDTQKNKEDSSKKKAKRIIKYINTKTMIILIVMLSFNAFAWFIYITKASLELSTHVTAWKIDFEADDQEITNDIVLELDNIYPGMEDYVKEIEVTNKGEISAKLSYQIEEIEIFGEKFEIGEQYTSDDLQEILNSYPFRISIEASTEQIEAETGKAKFIIKVIWPFESGDDALDTYYGNKSYEFRENNPNSKGLIVKFKLIAKESIN